jgi:ATP-dependent protease HslVU (ClpYQ) peptidase subunit
MTCIVAVKQGGQVFMGADSCASDGFTFITDVDDKIYKLGDFIIGSAGSVRVKDVFQYNITIPENLNIDNIEKFIRVDFVTAYRKILEEHGSKAKHHDGTDANAGAMLVAWKDQCFEIYSDFSVITLKNRTYSAIGSGTYFALGSLKTTENDSNITPKKRILAALEAAEAFQSGVKGPFHTYNT